MQKVDRSPLHPAEKKAVDAIVDFISEKGHSPTVREVADLMGWKSHGSAYTTLRRLRDKGWVTWEQGTSRTLKVVS